VNIIKASELNARIAALTQNSTPFVVVNILGSKKEKVEYTDKKTGAAARFFYFAHKGTTLAEEADLIIVKDPVAKGEDGEKATRPSFRGQQVLCILRGMEKDNRTGIMQYEATEMHVIQEEEVA